MIFRRNASGSSCTEQQFKQTDTMNLRERKRQGGRKKEKEGGDTCKGLEKGKVEMTQFYLITKNDFF